MTLSSGVSFRTIRITGKVLRQKVPRVKPKKAMQRSISSSARLVRLRGGYYTYINAHKTVDGNLNCWSNSIARSRHFTTSKLVYIHDVLDPPHSPLNILRSLQGSPTSPYSAKSESQHDLNLDYLRNRSQDSPFQSFVKSSPAKQPTIDKSMFLFSLFRFQIIY